MTFYKVPLTQITAGGDSTLPITAGRIKMKAIFSWDDTIQEQEDIFVRTLEQLSVNDPLLSRGEYVRTYDYIDFYTSIDIYHLEEWLNNTEIMPLSIVREPQWRQVEILEERINDCKTLRAYRETLKELLRWQCVVTTDGSKTVALVETGGWYQHQDNVFMFRFVSDLERIGREQISLVTMEIGVND